MNEVLMISVLKRLALTGVFAISAASAASSAERMVEIPTRAGHSVRAVLIAPDNAPSAAVILLSGGDGLLDITPDGRITSGTNNQVVRTRADYARAGFLTLVPDIADDFKTGDKSVANGYRWSPEHAQDIGALVMWLRAKTPKVHLVGTSRAALSVANAATRLEGAARPDTIVITSGMLMQVNTRQPSVERSVGNLDRITMPVLLIYHRDDACSVSPPNKVQPFKALLTEAASVDVVMLSGGRTQGDPCEAMSYHGYLGIDGDVVKAVTAWLNSH
jgi:pimeloyl-ACP methyl ester carboxylesterase